MTEDGRVVVVFESDRFEGDDLLVREGMVGFDIVIENRYSLNKTYILLLVSL